MVTAMVGQWRATRRRRGDLTLTGEDQAPPFVAMEPVWVMPQGAGPIKLEDEDVARLPERREGLRRAACRARRLSRSNTPSATPRWAWRPIRASSPTSTVLPILADSAGSRDPASRHHHLPPALHARHHRRAGGRIAGRDLPAAAPQHPMHEWHEKSGAYFEPVGLWRRPYCFPRPAKRMNRRSTARS
jgi:sarcosine oxidase subunit alpha